mgnify:CR=1 FL=1
MFTRSGSVAGGSPPLARGKRLGPECLSGGRVDHPRSRGENPIRMAMSCGRTGSPPLARGKPLAMYLDGVTVGITPARAGKTSPLTTGPPRAADHPRSRGENASGSGPDRRAGGSPPLARGKRAIHSAARDHGRITPARAGKTRRLSYLTNCPKDHPRSRGENSGPAGPCEGSTGSPPLARGKR